MSSLSAFIIPQVKKENLDMAIRSGGFLDEFHRDLGNSGNRVLSAIDGNTSLYDISRSLGLSETGISEVVEYLAIRGLLRVSKLCPLIQEKDARFDAYLDLIGLPSKDYQLLERAKTLCNGDRSLMDISERLGVVPEQLYEVLQKLGDEVEWKLIEVSGLVDEA
jgi:aminopeptidase-like protein